MRARSRHPWLPGAVLSTALMSSVACTPGSVDPHAHDAADRTSSDATVDPPDGSGPTETGTADVTTHDGGFAPVRCDPSPSPACVLPHELPVPTHYDGAAHAFRYLATDLPPRFLPSPLGSRPYTQGTCYPVYAGGFMPAADHYYGDNFAVFRP
ncbi:MAG: hypothetical protein WCJ30_17930, partial [Deltaproteobacteria bacterium]